MSLFSGNIKMGVHAIRAARWRSLFTMLGIIIGIVAVVTIVSIGEGVKRQIAGQITHLGNNLITIRPGNLVKRDAHGNIVKVNLLAGLGSSSLSESDIAVVQKAAHAKVVVPTSLVSGVASTSGRQFGSGIIIGTNENMPTILNQKVLYGSFFSADDGDKPVAIIGPQVAQQLFEENVPLGRTLTIRGQDFIVEGVFDQFQNNPLIPGSDFNSAIFIPYDVAKHLSEGNTQIFQILVKPDSSDLVPETAADIRAKLTAAHGGQEDFTVLTQDENLAVNTNILTSITNAIAGIAAISLLVGGIGIMNIMFVSVTERTREIGIRKAVGATNRQIMNQFLVEALVLSLVGGVVGIALSILANFLIRIFTDLRPVVTLSVVLIAGGVSLGLGIIFGTVPAAKAARKDPIDSLRFE